ncbi:MAG: hypothetical protein CMJ64_24270 [Planctomycetaceae bacterium]|nr:hypothetical protein [Planctomycetaceae bacterium]
MPLEVFHPLIQQWFTDRFGEPTKPQTLGWPQIAAGNHTLIAAPTGSGKTLAAFLVCLDRLWRDWLDGKLEQGTRVVYVSPLKALSNDIDRNLQTPLAEIRQLAADSGYDPPPIRTAVRTGDTPSSSRRKMLRQPPHVLVTTPESLYLLLTAEKSRETETDNAWIVLCAADPLNLAGIILPGQRVTANQKNYLILQDGRCVAAKQSGQVELCAEVDRETEAAMRRAMQTGRKDAQTHIRERWLAEDRKPRPLPELTTSVPSRSLRQT